MTEKSRLGILKSSFGVSIATLLSRVLGLVRVMFEARVLGGGSVASAWFSPLRFRTSSGVCSGKGRSARR